MSELLTKQQFFSLKLSAFIIDCNAKGFGVTFGEAWRPPEMAELYAKKEKGIVDSLHCSRLACDLNFFDKGNNLIETPFELAKIWEGYSTPDMKCRAGLFFTKVDGDHFSIEYQGRS